MVQILPPPTQDPFAFQNTRAGVDLINSIMKAKQIRQQRNISSGINQIALQHQTQAETISKQFSDDPLLRFDALNQLQQQTRGQVLQHIQSQTQAPQRKGLGGAVGGIFDAINPLTPSTGQTPLTQGIQGQALGQIFGQQKMPTMDELKARAIGGLPEAQRPGALGLVPEKKSIGVETVDEAGKPITQYVDSKTFEPLKSFPRESAKGTHIKSTRVNPNGETEQVFIPKPGTKGKVISTGVIVKAAPTETVGSLRADKIKELQEKEKAKTITKVEKAELGKLLIGQPQVSINLGKPASPSERTAIAETRASIDSLNNLKSLFDNTQTKTGPVVGRISPTKGLLGMTTDEQEAFMAATSAFKNAVIKQITGAQMSEVEAKRIMKQIPDITDPSVRWKAKWEQTVKNLEFVQQRRSEVLAQSGLRVPTEQGGSTETMNTAQLNTEGLSTEQLAMVDTLRSRGVPDVQIQQAIEDERGLQNANP